MAMNAFLKKIQNKERKAVGTNAGTVAFIKGKAILEVPVDQIDEDPNQPRTSANAGFSEEALAGLAESIASNGLLQPISVHEHPKDKNRYVINHGARRFRAVKSLGWKTIQAIVDSEYSEQKQLIENLQREDLSLLEIVESLQAIKQNFKRNGDLAKAVGKSDAWVSQMLSLSKLSPEIEALLKNGLCQDTLVLIGLNKLLQTNPDEVKNFIAAGQLTRTALDALKRSISEAQAAAEAAQENISSEEPNEEEAGAAEPSAEPVVKAEPASEAAEDESSTDEKEEEPLNAEAEEPFDAPAASADENNFEGSEEEAPKEPAAPKQVSHLVIDIDGRRARLVLDRPLLVQFEDGEAELVKLSDADI